MRGFVKGAIPRNFGSQNLTCGGSVKFQILSGIVPSNSCPPVQKARISWSDKGGISRNLEEIWLSVGGLWRLLFRVFRKQELRHAEVATLIKIRECRSVSRVPCAGVLRFRGCAKLATLSDFVSSRSVVSSFSQFLALTMAGPADFRKLINYAFDWLIR